MGEERVVGAAIGARIARISAPVDTRSDRTVHPIPLFNEHRGIAAVETPTPGAMTDHLSIEPVFEQAGEDLDLLPHHGLGIFDQVRLKTEIVAGQRSERRRVPGVQVHPDLAGAAGKEIAPKLHKDAGHRHLVVRKVDRLESEALAQRLEPGQVLGVAGGDLARPCPEIVALGVDGDDERRLRHGEQCARRSCRRRAFRSSSPARRGRSETSPPWSLSRRRRRPPPRAVRSRLPSLPSPFCASCPETTPPARPR